MIMISYQAVGTLVYSNQATLVMRRTGSDANSTATYLILMSMMTVIHKKVPPVGYNYFFLSNYEFQITTLTENAM